MNSSSEMSEKRRHLFRAVHFRTVFYSLRSEKQFGYPNYFSKRYYQLTCVLTEQVAAVRSGPASTLVSCNSMASLPLPWQVLPLTRPPASPL